MIVAILRKFMSFVEMATTSKLEEKDGEIVADSQLHLKWVQRNMFVRFGMSKTFELLEERSRKSAPGTKRSLFCYFASSLRALLQVKFQNTRPVAGGNRN